MTDFSPDADDSVGSSLTAEQASADAADGRGLHIVAGLATRWGVERDGMGQRVWAEFDPTPAPTPTPRPNLVPAG